MFFPPLTENIQDYSSSCEAKTAALSASATLEAMKDCTCSGSMP